MVSRRFDMCRKILCIVLTLSLIVGILSGVLFYKNPTEIQADEVNGIELSVLKIWDDYSDFDNIRPESIDVTLYQNNERTNVTVTLSDSNGWFYRHNVLAAREDNNGDEIHYTWRCDEIDGYQRYTDTIDNMFIITDVHHCDAMNDDTVVLQRLDDNEGFLDACNMRLKDAQGSTLITWISNDDSSIEVTDSRLDASMDDDGSLVVEGLPAGNYIYEEVTPKDGYTSAGSKRFKVEKGGQSYDYNWYTSLESAINDANDLTTDNTDCYRDDEDCEAGLFIIDNVAHLLLLKDKTASEDILFNADTVADFENHTLTLAKNNQVQFLEDLTLCNGTIETNSISAINADISSENYSTGNLYIEKFIINNEYEDDEITTVNVKTVTGDHLSQINIDRSEINSISTVNIAMKSSNYNYCVYLYNDHGNISITDSSLISNNISSNTSCLIETSTLYFRAETAAIHNSVIRATNQSSNKVFALRYLGGYNKPVINISGCNITANSSLTASNGSRYNSVTAVQTTVDNEFNFFDNNIQTFSSFGTFGLILNNKSSNTINQCNMWGNTIHAGLKAGVADAEAYGIHVNACKLHLMSGNVWASPSRMNGSGNSDNTHYDSWGNGIRCTENSSVIIDETKGETVVAGGNAGIGILEKANVIINGGTFKSPNHGGAYVNSGPLGHCEINGGSFLCNGNEYTNEELNGVHAFGGLYFAYYGSKTDAWTVNVRNATIKGGTYGIRVKSNANYRGATVYVYNSYVKGNSNDIFLDKTSTSENAYCYIESGTVLCHDGTDQTWVDGYANAGLPPHIIDNR